MINKRSDLFIKLIGIPAAIIFFIAILQTTGYAQDINADFLKPLEYRHIGPQGNRMIAVAGEPGNFLVCYAGAASGAAYLMLGCREEALDAS